MHFSEFDIPHLPRGRKETGWLEVASRPDGSAWRLPLLYVTGASAGPTLIVTAAVHGDEYEGVATIPRIFQQIQAETLRGNLVMVPVCNMPAYEAVLRSSPIDGLNLARVFPGDANGTITRRIAYWLTEKLLKQADLFIDLHSGGIASDIPTLIGYLHQEDELGQRSQAAAKAFGAPVLWGHPPPIPPGRSISAALALGVPALYTEAPGGGEARADDIACFVEGVINVMKHLDMIAGQPQPRPMTHHLLGDGDLDPYNVISAPVAGYFQAEIEVLARVTPGQRLGTIQDFSGRVIAELTANRDGVVVMLRRLPRVNVGDGLVQVTGQLG